MSYGRSMLPLWPLDPAATYLNHGTVGVVPRKVLEAQQRWRDRIERHPSRFMLRELWSFSGAEAGSPTLMRQAAAEVASFVGANANDLVFVDNTTTGVNAVVRSMPLGPGGEIVITDHAYGGIVTAVRHAAARHGATVTVVQMPYPAFDAGEAVRRIQAALSARTRLVITDHIVSETALIFPVEAIVRACHARHVPVLIDGAHVPGALDLNVSAIGADFYVANLHKWAMAPRSCAFLVVAPAFQAAMHPPVISWGYGAGYTQEFDWVGTRDPTPWLSAPDGIRFLRELGFDELRRYNHDLAWRAARHLTDTWKTPLEIDESMVGCMVAVMTPESCGTDKPAAVRLRDRLLNEHDIEVHAHARAGRVWVRVSAQIYNEDKDIEQLSGACLLKGTGAGVGSGPLAVMRELSAFWVEQVFLVDRQTGLLLQHVAAASVLVKDADQVAAMLTAIRDLVERSFAAREKGSLETLKVGDLQVLVEQGPHAFIAGVVRGRPTRELPTVLQGALEEIHVNFGRELQEFQGDPSPFDRVRTILESCLIHQYRRPGT